MTTPPLLRPPGANYKSTSSKNKLPILKIQTPAIPDIQTITLPSTSSSSPTISYNSSISSYSSHSATSNQIPKLPALLPGSASSKSSRNTTKSQKLRLTVQDAGSTDASTPIRLDPSCVMNSNFSSSSASLNIPPSLQDERRLSESTIASATLSDTNSTLLETMSAGIPSPLISSMNNMTIQRRGVLSPGLANKHLDDLSESEWKEISALDQITTLEVLGEGNGGSVKKCSLKTTGEIFALKTITADPSPEFQKQIVRELNYNKSFQSQYIVKYYGTYFNELDACICICMEYMGGRSLDAVYKNFKSREGRVGEKALGKIAEGVLRGLSYLNQQKIMHRDIKPQNILLDSKGNVKLCDFGVSGEVVNSLATTFTGTSFYMAPERIRNEPYTITCDVWSLGLTLLEGAVGYFPFASSDPNLLISPIELLLIILEFEPKLEDEPEENIVWSASFKDFLRIALIKENRKRPSPRQMLEHPWMKGQMAKKVKMDKLVQYCWGDNM
ncbi:hypothetical protein CANARDRAFT_6296 [[Candida] arabinofermentans NRRL YB-2248]|uniref:mitogen-activated protein kinase kinase n=1 Tax=[Candida] arabinofermentans NRRL YB-2248 TaxID=983967 RepID=A0A1E4T4S1_9ASCO|nr:hypothetical protein CANARDRAFT_6296 [[Candida] arabinofermentans NRRL YB-2248]